MFICLQYFMSSNHNEMTKTFDPLICMFEKCHSTKSDALQNTAQITTQTVNICLESI